MKKLIVLLVFFSITINAQNFVVEKISGTVKLLRVTSEKWEDVKVGQNLTGSDLLLTEENSLIQLSKDNETFLLKSDAAIGLNHIKKISINDLVLALTLDEIRNVPKIKRNSISKNTAVYWAEKSLKNNLNIDENVLGIKKINGAKQLNESGYTESSIIVAKEVFRNYPKVASDFNDRIYFADLLSNLKLYEEAASEYSDIEKLSLTENQKNILKQKKNEVSLRLMKNKK